jgi:lipopolysaccharide/colanic/teichoic acid biosynthesis glycosyltransferase
LQAKLKKGIRSLATVAPNLSGSAGRELLTVQRFRTTMLRERARSDRSKLPFAVVLFSLLPGSDSGRHINRLLKILRDRVRLTDDLGWYSAKELGVILPDTDDDGATHFAEKIIYAVTRAGLHGLQHGIFIYPEIWDSHGDDDDPEKQPPDTYDPAKRSVRRSHREKKNKALSVSIADAQAISHPALPHLFRLTDEMDEDDLRLAGMPQSTMEAVLIRPSPLAKRVLDTVVAGVALVMCSPLLMLIAAGIKLTSRGPVFFYQERAGRGGKPFKIAKFRTMVVDAEARKSELKNQSEQDGPAFKLTRDPRITRFGSFLRRTSLDELPQLWNILVGDMSLVGPRPLPIAESDACTDWYRRRLEVKPGLTCIWQVWGRSTVNFHEWMCMDMRYIQQLTFWHDLKLIFLTVPAVIWGRGAK